MKPDSDCIFCAAASRNQIVETSGEAFAIFDKYPVTDKHLLICPKRHVIDYFSLSQTEKYDIDNLLHICRKRLRDEDPTITGFNIGVNCGQSAGQTVFHCHVHLIPRRDGDTPSPRGGVRGVIPERRSYPVEMQLDPKYYGLTAQTRLEKLDDQTIAIAVHRKSRIIMADGKKLVEKAKKIQEKDSTLNVVVVTSAPVCSKTRDFLASCDILVKQSP